MMVSRDVFGLFATGVRKFAAQVTVSVAATVCATAIYGYIISDRSAFPAQQEAAASRLDGGVVEAKTLAYYPEHLAALDSLSRFQPVSAQRTAELAGAPFATRIASLSDAAKPRRITSAAEVLPPRRPVTVAQADVLPPRRPVAPAPVPTTMPPALVAEITPQPEPHARIWGMELPRFVPTGASVMDKLASVKERIGGLMHVSSR
jgi:hypothetical protein